MRNPTMAAYAVAETNGGGGPALLTLRRPDDLAPLPWSTETIPEGKSVGLADLWEPVLNCPAAHLDDHQALGH